jgi:8-oxo-dGTP diphosphatase
MEEAIGVPVIVLDKTKKRILLGIRKNCYGAGTYGLPGGRLELNEPLAECAKRELLEEIGLTAKALKFIGVVRDFQTYHNFIHFAFLCEDFDGEVELMEPEKCESWEWFFLDNLPENILPGHQQAIDIFLKKDFPLRDYIK